jgi:hypothetical protein
VTRGVRARIERYGQSFPGLRLHRKPLSPSVDNALGACISEVIADRQE